MDEELARNIERRVDMAREIQKLTDGIKTLVIVTGSCKSDRDALYDRMRQIDVQIGKIETKQKVASVCGYIFAFTGIAFLFNLVTNYIKNHQ